MTKIQTAAIERAHAGLLRIYRAVAPQLHVVSQVEPEAEDARRAELTLRAALEALQALLRKL